MNVWRIIEPFAQADPRVVEADVTAELEDFLQARIDGQRRRGIYPVDSDTALVRHDDRCRIRALRTRTGERTEVATWRHGLHHPTVRGRRSDDRRAADLLCRRRLRGEWRATHRVTYSILALPVGDNRERPTGSSTERVARRRGDHRLSRALAEQRAFRGRPGAR